MNKTRNQSRQQLLRLSQAANEVQIPENSAIINLSRKRIFMIDKMDVNFIKVRVLNLSHNHIKQLGQIKQFSQLKNLDLSFNQIEDQSQLIQLNYLPKLETVFLKQNAFLSRGMSATIQKMLSLFKTDLMQIKLQMAEDPLLTNELMIILMQSMVKKLDLHLQLHTKNNFEFVTHPDINILYKHYAQIQHADQVLKNKYQRKLDQDVAIITKSFHKTHQQIRKDILQSQISIKKALNTKIESKVISLQQCTTLSNSRRFSNFLMKDSRSHNNSQNVSPFKLSPHKFFAQNSNLSTTNKISVSHSQRSSTKNQEQYEIKYRKNLIKINPVYHLLYSPLNSLKVKEKDLLIQTLSSHLKQKTIQLYKKDDAFKAYHKRYNQKLEQIQSENLQLKDQIKNKTNQIQEILNLQNKYQQSCSRLQIQLDRLHQQIQLQISKSSYYEKVYHQAIQQLNYIKQFDNKAKQNKLIKFSQILRSTYQMSIRRFLQTKIKSYNLQKHRLNQILAKSSTNLHNYLLTRKRLKETQLRLKSFLLASAVRKIVKQQRKQKQVKKNQKYLVRQKKKKEIILSRLVFLNWKCNTFQQKTESMSKKIKALNDIIQNLTLRDGFFEQSIKQELVKKSEQLMSVQKLINDLQFELVNKDIKYEKQKHVYDATISQMQIRQQQYLIIINQLQYTEQNLMLTRGLYRAQNF